MQERKTVRKLVTNFNFDQHAVSQFSKCERITEEKPNERALSSFESDSVSDIESKDASFKSSTKGLQL